MSGSEKETSATSVGINASTQKDRTLRRRILEAGIICFNVRHATRPCTVRNTSDGGARLQVEGAMTVPDTFELNIPLDGLWIDCEVVWRGRDSLGVRYTSPATNEKPSRKQVVQPIRPPVKPSLRRAGSLLAKTP